MADPTTDDYFIASRIAWGPLIFQAARCARDMGLLKAVASEALTPTDVARRTGVSYYAARVLLEGCAAAELVRLEDGGRYQLTGAGRVMLTDALTTVNMNFVHDVCYEGAFHLRESLEQGKPAGLKELGGDWPTVYAGLTQLAPQVQKSWFAFDHFYSDPLFRHALKLLSTRGTKTVLDVGGNTGRFAVQAAKIAAVTVLDHPAQLKFAEQTAAKAGVTLTTHAFDLLDHSRAFPKPFDAVWMSQLLDCFPEADITGLLRRARGRRCQTPVACTCSSRCGTGSLTRSPGTTFRRRRCISHASRTARHACTPRKI